MNALADIYIDDATETVVVRFTKEALEGLVRCWNDAGITTADGLYTVALSVEYRDGTAMLLSTITSVEES